MGTKLNILPLKEWFDTDGKPLIISGPCSAESEEQIMQTGLALAKIPQVKMIRAGIWKPRTRPDIFEGVGEVGLEWLKNLKIETGLKTCVEVANPQHVEACLKNEVDVLWIGARTTANPFSVQEIADSLKGVDIPVMIKNPLHPDLKLWIGAFERLNQVGIDKLLAIHRGFYTYEKTPFRNLPMWEIPIELKRLVPTLAVITDPSHICGNRELLQNVSQKAMDLAMDGLMIESHINPSVALTDASQQLKPEKLKNLLDQLVLRQEFGNEDFENLLEKLRFEIDHIDEELLMILSRRMHKIEEIGYYKKDNNITVLQMDRLRQMMISRLKMGKDLDLNNKFVLKLLQLVHKDSIQAQTKIMME
ncbi:MAG: 3-deoxy-7-phosphoheptulonate synthase [Bacteroidetes bacterium]|nr:MAG: 3-deoxy-7-phosphoheptulonate synthase [Bacteroidota bacterium]